MNKNSYIIEFKIKLNISLYKYAFNYFLYEIKLQINITVIYMI